PDDAPSLAARQVGLISRVFRVAEHDLQISASLGIALYPGNGQDAQELLMNADAAMYHAKGAGKNGYSFFDASMNSNARKQLQLLQDLRNPWSISSSACITSRSSRRIMAGRSALKPCCAGSTRLKACCCRTNLSP